MPREAPRFFAAGAERAENHGRAGLRELAVFGFSDIGKVAGTGGSARNTSKIAS
jgi:hypothetical protein